jgi:hypothetical protein
MKLISIEEVNVLVKYVVGLKNPSGTGRVIGEANRKVRILTDEGTIATRYVVGDDFALEDLTLEEIVGNKDCTEMVKGRVHESEVLEWIINDVKSGSAPFDAICHVVSVLSMHGLWDPNLYKCIEENYEEIKKRFCKLH